MAPTTLLAGLVQRSNALVPSCGMGEVSSTMGSLECPVPVTLQLALLEETHNAGLNYTKIPGPQMLPTAQLGSNLVPVQSQSVVFKQHMPFLVPMPSLRALRQMLILHVQRYALPSAWVGGICLTPTGRGPNPGPATPVQKGHPAGLGTLQDAHAATCRDWLPPGLS